MFFILHDSSSLLTMSKLLTTLLSALLIYINPLTKLRCVSESCVSNKLHLLLVLSEEWKSFHYLGEEDLTMNESL